MKKIKYLLVMLLTSITSISFVSAAECMYCSDDALGIPALIPKFVSNGITLFQVLIPVILIIVGMVQFMKVVASGEDKVAKESVNSLVRSIVSGIVVFLLVAIVRTVFSTFLKTEGRNAMKCVSCFMNYNSTNCNIAACPIRPQECSGLKEAACNNKKGCKFEDGKCVFDNSYNPGETVAKRDCNDFVYSTEGCPKTAPSGQKCKVVNISGSSTPVCLKKCSYLERSECSSRPDCEWRASSSSSTPKCYDK